MRAEGGIALKGTVRLHLAPCAVVCFVCASRPNPWLPYRTEAELTEAVENLRELVIVLREWDTSG